MGARRTFLLQQPFQILADGALAPSDVHGLCGGHGVAEDSKVVTGEPPYVIEGGCVAIWQLRRRLIRRAGQQLGV
jgi:hypothetical protein